jgi:hypothetical protein
LPSAGEKSGRTKMICRSFLQSTLKTGAGAEFRATPGNRAFSRTPDSKDLYFIDIKAIA